MAKTINIDNDKKEIIRNLQKAVQSANLNFLFGSGCSTPVLQVLQNIEQEIEKLRSENKDNEANKKLSEFLASFLESTNILVEDQFIEKCETTEQCNLLKTFQNYRKFIQAISNILFERKSNILHKQATIFTTSYDLFIEKASESLSESVILNDGFNRTPSLTNSYTFSPKQFFNTVFNTGNLYNYQVQVPVINLVKLHGSLNWQPGANTIIQSLCYLKKADGLKDETGADKIAEFIDLFSLVLPKKDKFKETILNQTYYDLLRIYTNELDRENTLLIAEGFSFADEHILDLTKRALKNPTLKLVIFCFDKDPKEYVDKFSSFNNVDIIYSEKENLDFKMFNSILLDILPQKPDTPVDKVETRESADE
ncbi:MAG: SIR2 family protein [Nitrospirota bacterium]|nr:SIR2 family protein [Nitrospirota bacterium]